MKKSRKAIDGKKVFFTEKGNFSFSEMRFYYSEKPVEFSQINELTTINYSSNPRKKKKNVC